MGRKKIAITRIQDERNRQVREKRGKKEERQWGVWAGGEEEAGRGRAGIFLYVHVRYE